MLGRVQLVDPAGNGIQLGLSVELPTIPMSLFLNGIEAHCSHAHGTGSLALRVPPGVTRSRCSVPGCQCGECLRNEIITGRVFESGQSSVTLLQFTPHSTGEVALEM